MQVQLDEIGNELSACRGREVLDRVGDKWSMYVIALLGTGTKRFSELRKAIEGISPRMLTVTLRTLERDGLVLRKVYPVVPPRVDYTLTPMGETLLDTVASLVNWANAHLTEIDAARASYDRALIETSMTASDSFPGANGPE